MAFVNSSNASKKEILLFFNTLCGLVKNLEKRYTTIDLRNECCVTGKIIKVDGFMNIEMEDVVFYDMRGSLISIYKCTTKKQNIKFVFRQLQTTNQLLCQCQNHKERPYAQKCRCYDTAQRPIG